MSKSTAAPRCSAHHKQPAARPHGRDLRALQAGLPLLQRSPASAASLPDCLSSLFQRKKDARGYFSPERFQHRGNKAVADEIAMNPDHFEGRTDKEVLSTFVHEMTHLWQQHFGKPRGGYCTTKQWAEKMDDIGLAASSTGADGGKRTGQSVSHYIVGAVGLTAPAPNFPPPPPPPPPRTSGATIAWVSVPVLKITKSGKRTKYACPSLWNPCVG